MRSIDSVIRSLPSPDLKVLEASQYRLSKDNELGGKVGLAVESMRFHTTDEGWQLFQGLEQADYMLCGYNLMINETNVSRILERLNPHTLVLNDKREWDVKPNDFREPKARFTGVEVLRKRDDLFKVTVLKDAHQRGSYHRKSAEEINCHAWITYYHPKIVKHLAPYVREEHLIRTYHSVDKYQVPEYRSTAGYKMGQERKGCLISGAVSSAYPLRKRLIELALSQALPDVTVLKHPGYSATGCYTPSYLKILSQYKVAICTSSIYGYSLRKLIEATACGCVVVTDLPDDEVLPIIDRNLVRIPVDITARVLTVVLKDLYNRYDPERQRELAEQCKEWYDFRVQGRRLAEDIEGMRQSYTSR